MFAQRVRRIDAARATHQIDAGHVVEQHCVPLRGALRFEEDLSGGLLHRSEGEVGDPLEGAEEGVALEGVTLRHDEYARCRVVTQDGHQEMASTAS